MGKLFGLILIVVGVWVGMEIYTQGVNRAFGGLFAGVAEEAADLRSPLERIQDKGRHASDAQLERIERQLNDSSVGYSDQD